MVGCDTCIRSTSEFLLPCGSFFCFTLAKTGFADLVPELGAMADLIGTRNIVASSTLGLAASMKASLADQLQIILPDGPGANPSSFSRPHHMTLAMRLQRTKAHLRPWSPTVIPQKKWSYG